MAPRSGMVLPRHFIGITGADEISSLPEELEEIERARVENALEANDWNTAAAARLLGMSRTTLGGRMKKLGIRKPRAR
jgi:transcriptional regulator with GAF, ATPase, and Fis domain